MKHEWNTGRQYDAHGQRMVAKVEDAHILFSDRSRHVNGVIPLGEYLQGRSLRPFEIENLVMQNYDLGNYSASALTLYMEGESKPEDRPSPTFVSARESAIDEQAAEYGDMDDWNN